MKKILSVALAAATLAVAMPAAAAPGGINAQEARIAQRIEQGARNGALTRPEAQRLRSQLREIERLEQNYRRNGLSNFERNDLERRLDNLSARVSNQRHDDQRRGGHRR
jgi:TolA-binding protein